MSIFEGYDMNGNVDDNTGLYYHQTKRMITHVVVHAAQRQPNNERLRMGAQMVRLGIGSIAAPAQHAQIMRHQGRDRLSKPCHKHQTLIEKFWLCVFLR